MSLAPDCAKLRKSVHFRTALTVSLFIVVFVLAVQVLCGIKRSVRHGRGAAAASHAEYTVPRGLRHVPAEDRSCPPPPLRRAWANRTLSPLAERMRRSQANCTHVVAWPFDASGMGSNFHVWSQALCLAMEQGASLATPGPWTWADPELCDARELVRPLSCYFGDVAPCAVPLQAQQLTPYVGCSGSAAGRREPWRFASMEYLFSQVSPKLLLQTRQAARRVFGCDGPPPDLITVHIRWGDKVREMRLPTPRELVGAVARLAERHGLARPSVFLIVGESDGLEAFLAMAPPEWTVYVYTDSVTRIGPAPGGGGRLPSMHQLGARSGGQLGTASLISLLLGLEARYYVLTRASNWSRLIDELRAMVADAQCGGCTDTVDLRPGSW